MKTIFSFIKKYSKYIFVLYLIVMFLVLVMKFPQMDMFYGIIERWTKGIKLGFADKPQLIPFKTIIEYVNNTQAIYDWFAKNLMVNIIMFMPCGFLLPLFLKKNRIWQVLMIGIVLSVIIEIIQTLLSVGTADIDDVILNTFGTFIGFGIYKLIYDVWINKSKRKTAN